VHTLFGRIRYSDYTKELVLLIFQLNYLLSDRMKHEVLYMRTVNNHGRRGKNIACDLCMEHHNRYSTQKASNRKYKLEIVTHHLYFPCRDLKNFIGDRSSNVSRKDTVYRCSRGLSSLQNIRR
jgi:hypothetical protein